MDPIPFSTRLWLFFVLPWKVLFDAAFAAKVQRLREGQAELPAATTATQQATPAVSAPTESDPTTALQLLAILQREGRFIDFLQEDVASFSDAEVGAAARVVHEGCKRGLKDYVSFLPVRTETEGAPVVLDRGYDATRNRVTGNVVGEPPYRGKLAHHGWLVQKIRLPSVSGGHNPLVVAPAEVEI